MPETTAGETCANCDTPIGRLETPHVWRDQIVCPACYARLGGPTPVAALDYARPTKKAKTIPCPACRKDISPKADACPHCGQPIMAAKTSRLMRTCRWLFGSLLILAIVAAVIFFAAGEKESGLNAISAVPGLALFWGLTFVKRFA